MRARPRLAPPIPYGRRAAARFAEVDLGSGDLRPRNGENLHWNVDHLLDRPEASLTRVYAIRSQRRMARAIGEMLLAGP
jgi:hypothetical protein